MKTVNGGNAGRKPGEQHMRDLRELVGLLNEGKTPRGALAEFLRRRGVDVEGNAADDAMLQKLVEVTS